mmetsp:Transcript_19768/g.55743  ORF Transcript_19768/g.55743 Transcript_19768/m.55743 type:complete len:85 (-) Transcript_19768:10-264(-)
MSVFQLLVLAVRIEAVDGPAGSGARASVVDGRADCGAAAAGDLPPVPPLRGQDPQGHSQSPGGCRYAANFGHGAGRPQALSVFQ